jgi:hypothetical protein
MKIKYGELLGIGFIALKLADVIDWPWWAVTLPIWIGPALFCSIAVLFVVIGMVSMRIKDRK